MIWWWIVGLFLVVVSLVVVILLQDARMNRMARTLAEERVKVEQESAIAAQLAHELLVRALASGNGHEDIDPKLADYAMSYMAWLCYQAQMVVNLHIAESEMLGPKYKKSKIDLAAREVAYVGLANQLYDKIGREKREWKKDLPTHLREKV